MNGVTVPKFSPDDVQRLYYMVSRHLAAPFRFVCLSDRTVPGIECIPLRHQLPGWWAKLELFRTDLPFDRIFYIDLDTVILGDITPLVNYEHNFTMLHDFKRSERFASGIMAWQGDYSFLLDNFLADPDYYMNRHAKDPALGDQAFISEHLGYVPQAFQEIWPGALESYKADVCKRFFRRPGRDARMVCFHGYPGVMDVQHNWLRKAIRTPKLGGT